MAKREGHRAGVAGPPPSSALTSTNAGRASGSWSQQRFMSATRSEGADSALLKLILF